MNAPIDPDLAYDPQAPSRERASRIPDHASRTTTLDTFARHAAAHTCPSYWTRELCKRLAVELQLHAAAHIPRPQDAVVTRDMLLSLTEQIQHWLAADPQSAIRNP